jgi:sialate O-acetylesterase
MASRVPARAATTAILFALAAVTAGAGVMPAPYFRNHAVLQREKPVPVWGRADPDETIVVTFREQRRETVADSSGRWSVTLAPMPASAEPASLVIYGRNTVTARNVVVGEVWLCSGQSNMLWPVKNTVNAAAEIAAADYPLIRHFSARFTLSAEPRDDIAGAWQECRPGVIGNFSSTAYYFGRELFKKFNVPVGLLHCSCGGTQIESWMTVQTLAADPNWPEINRRWREEREKFPFDQARHEQAYADWIKSRAAAAKERREFKTPRPRESRQPALFYNGMITPFVPAAIRGIIWYQGEANVEHYAEYRTVFPALIRQWRADFQQGDIPFYYVQLAGYGLRPMWEFLREAQDCALKLPGVGRAVVIDIGEKDDIHPKNKQEVGRRLALAAFAKTYGLVSECSGPVFASVGREGAALRVTFTHAAGLATSDPALPGFVLAGADRKFVPARARIEGESIVVSAPEVSEPVAVRYAWESWPPAPLYNAAGLPAAPFRTDDWPGPPPEYYQQWIKQAQTAAAKK